MGDVLDTARRLVADNYGRTSDILRFARALLAADRAVEVARQYDIPDLVAAVAEYDEAVK